jgi:putative ABC transport system permease protein
MGWLARVANAFRPRLDREIDEELEFHLAERTRDLIAAGRSPETARQEAARRLGNRLTIRERVRDSNVIVELERVLQDLRNGARGFVRDRGLGAVAILSIAIGTGANVAIFSVTDTLLLRPLPIAQPDSVLAVGSRLRTPNGHEDIVMSYADYLDFRERSRTFAGTMAQRYEFVAFGKSATDSNHVRVASFVTDNFFSVLGVNLALGRAFTPAEASQSAPEAVVVLSDAFWRAEFQCDPSVVGSSMRIAGRPFTIVGVAPTSFLGLLAFRRESFFLPVGMLPRLIDVQHSNVLDARDARVFTVKARLAPGETVERAQVELDQIGRQLTLEHPDPYADRALIAESDFQFRFGPSRLMSSMLVLTAVLSMAVLCVACANVASLLAGRAPARAREMALRLAVGASRVRLVRQLMTESLALAAVGGLAGLIVARLGISLLRGIQIPSDVISAPELQLDERALLFSIAVVVTTAFMAGLVPALHATRVNLATSLKSGDRGSTRDTRRGRVVLVAIQLALSVVLVTVSAFTFRFFQSAVTTGPGFRVSKIAKLTVDAGQARSAPRDAGQFFAEVLERVRALPGVQSASVVAAMPMASSWRELIAPADRDMTGEEPLSARVNSVDPRYFDTIAIDLTKGRRFTTDDDASARPVAIVNETLADQFWPGRNPVGQSVRVLETPSTAVEVVGVVKTTTYHIIGEAPEPAIYFPYRQRPRAQMTVLAATNGESAALVEPLRQTIANLDRDVPIFDADTIEHWYAVGSTGTLLSVVRLIGALGVMGLALSSIGLYGLVAYGVSRRTREFGIRMATGASPGRIVTMVVRQGTPPAWIGLTSGLVLSIVATRSLSALVPVRVDADTRLHLTVIPLLITVALLAAVVPALRAGRVDPTTALRDE